MSAYPEWLGPAIALGHDLVPDPPSLSLGEIGWMLRNNPERLKDAIRWTCRTCCAAACKPYTPVYGAAFDKPCSPQPNNWHRVPSWSEVAA
jgi:hypothetical protein